MTKILVSACLLGQRVRYDGGHSASGAQILARWRREGRVVAFCPEVAGGLPTPRPPAQIIGGDGDAVLDGAARVMTEAGEDVTEAFVQGAKAVLDVARKADVRVAVLKSKSPSCGSLRIYDGTFARGDAGAAALIPGAGVSAALLRRHGIGVFNEHQFESAQRYLQDLNRAPTERSNPAE
jgi:uncharacterized protein YbbK (DUF523 family)